MPHESPAREHVTPAAADVQAERRRQLRALVPEAFVEGALDFAKLRAALGETDSAAGERYTFTWAGKGAAQRLIQQPSHATLHPAPDESINWATTQNLFIEGDNLEVLKLLYRAYYGRVKLIYIDPPYNTGNDFVYPDDYSDSLAAYLTLTGQQNATGDLLTSNPETSGRYHSRWLSMLYPRLFVARQLLRDDGLLFVSIDDSEVHNLRLLLNEVFGEENFLGVLIWKRRQNVDSRAKSGLSVDHEYLLMYARNSAGRIRGQEKDLTKYSNPDHDPRGDWLSADLTGLATKEQRPNLHYDLVNPATGMVYMPPENGWRYGKPTMARLIADARIIWPKTNEGRPRVRRYLHEMGAEFTGLSSIITTLYNSQGTRELKELFDGKEVLDFPKPVDYLKLLVEQGTSTDEPEIVLDFFAGSCTTAQAVLELNRQDGGSRRYVMVQLPFPTKIAAYKTIAEIGKERIRRVIKKLTEERREQLDLNERTQPEDVGFRVFKLAASNLKQWPGHTGDEADEYMQLSATFANLLVEPWTADGVLWEVAIKEGLRPTASVETVPNPGPNTVQRVTDADTGRFFLICLDETIDPSLQDTLTLSRETLFICRDSAIDDTTHANLALACHVKTL